MAFFLLSSSAWAAGPTVWNGAGPTNNWSDSLNWVGGLVPTFGAQFDATSPKPCFVDVPVSGVSLSILGTYTGTISVNPGANPSFTSFIQSGGTFSMGSSDVITGPFTLSGGTFNASPSNTLRVSGNYSANSPGNFFHNNGFVEMFPSGAVTLSTNLGLGSLRINGGGTVGISTLLFAAGDVLLMSGILNTTGGLGMTGSYIQSGGTFNASAATFQVGMNFTVSGGTFNAGSGTVTFNTAGVGSLATSQALNNVIVNKASGALSLSMPLSVAGTFQLQNGNFSLNGFPLNHTNAYTQTGGTLSLPAGSVYTTSGNFTQSAGSIAASSTGDLVFSGTSAQTVGAVSQLGRLICNKGANTLNQTGALSLVGDLQIQNGTYSSGANTINCMSFVQSGGTFNHGTGAIMNLNGNFSVTGGTFMPGSGTLQFTGGAPATYQCTFGVNNVTVNKAASSLTQMSGLTCSGNFLLQAGVFNSNGINSSTGPFTQSGTAVFQGSPGTRLRVTGDFNTLAGGYVHNGAEFEAYGGGNASLNSPGPFHHFTFGKNSGTLTLTQPLSVGGNFTCFNVGTLDMGPHPVNIAGAYFHNFGTVQIGTSDLSVGGNFTLNNSAGLLSVGGWVVLNGTGTQDISCTLDIPNLKVNKPSGLVNQIGVLSNVGGFELMGGTYVLGFETMDVGNDINLSGGNLSISTGSVLFNSSFNMAPGTFSGSNSVLQFNGTATKFLTTNNNVLNSLELNNTAGSFVMQDSLQLSGSMTVNSGASLDSNGFDITVFGNWSMQGSAALAGSVTLAGASQAISGNTTFQNLIFAGPPSSSLYFAAASTQTINGTLDLQGAGPGLELNLFGFAPTFSWFINPMGPYTLRYLNVRDSTSLPPLTALDSVDLGNNVNWFFSSTTPTPTQTPCALNVTGLTVLPPGSYSYCGVHVYPGGTLRIQGLVTLNLGGDFVVDAGGGVDGNFLSTLVATGAADGNPGSTGGGGGGYGGVGGMGGDLSLGTPGGPIRGSASSPNLEGERGGNSDALGGPGGAALIINAAAFNAVLDGLLSFNGQVGTDFLSSNAGAGGGGSGGGLWVQALNISGSGTVQALGGDGGSTAGFNSFGGGGGGGGRINLCATGLNTYSGFISTDPGLGGFGGSLSGSDGDYGTYYLCGAPWMPTPTATPTRTRTSTSSPTRTPSPTRTSTRTPTGTASPTLTPTPSLTVTFSPTPSASPSTTRTPVGSILFVVGNPVLSLSDQAQVNRMENVLGYAVAVVDDDLATVGDAAGKDLVLISETVASGTVGALYRNVPQAVIACDDGLFDNMDMTGPTAAVDYASLAGQTQLDIVDPAHFLANGNSGTISVVSSAQTFVWGVPAPSAQKVASIAGDPGRTSIFAYEPGALMFNSLIAPGRRLGFYMGAGAANPATAAGWGLFDRAILWGDGAAPTTPTHTVSASPSISPSSSASPTASPSPTQTPACEFRGSLVINGSVQNAGNYRGIKVNVPVDRSLGGFQANIAGNGAANLAFGLYTDAGNYPGALLAQAQVSSPGNGLIGVPMAPVPLYAGNYWIVSNADGNLILGSDFGFDTLYLSSGYGYPLPSSFPGGGSPSAGSSYSIGILTCDLGALASLTPSPSPTPTPSPTTCALTVNGTSLTLTAGTYNYCSVLVTGNGSLFIQGAVVFDVVSFQVDAGSQVIGDGLGYAGGGMSSSGVGPGGGGAGGAQGAGGGGHGGMGGAGGLGSNGGFLNDNPADPLSPGSGGGGGNLGLGAAGGAALFVSATGSVTLNGLISVNGAGVPNVAGSGTDAAAGGGAAGSIYIRALNLGGSGGLLRADGGGGGGFSGCGVACYGGGGGSGGIVNLCISGTNSLSTGIQIFGGGGGSGTVVGQGGAAGLYYLCANNQISPTPTSTQSSSRTPSPTATVSASPSATDSPTLTQTPTGSNSPSPTDSPSPSHTPTLTASATSSFTHSPTLSSSPTPSISPSPTDTPSPSHTPTLTLTLTSSFTRTPTLSSSPTQSISPSPTDTPSPSPSPTLTASGTPTHTPTLSLTASPTRSGTGTLTPTPTPTHSGTLTATGTMTASPSGTLSLTSTFSTTLSASFSPTRSASQSPTHTPTPTASPSQTPFVTVTASPTISTTPLPTATAAVPVVTDRNVFKPEQGGTVQIGMRAPEDGKVVVRVYNLAGDKVCKPFEADVTAGLWFQATWNGKNETGDFVSSGVYFVSVKGAGIKSIKKVIVLK